MVKIIIKRVPLKYFYYFQWLILGFYQLSHKNEIDIVLRPKKLSEKFFIRFYVLYLGLRKHIKWFRQHEENNYCLEGEAIIGSKKMTFCFDIADSPYFFDIKKLQEVDLYFKAQCPREIKKEGFPLTPDIKIPYDEMVFLNLDKIKPTMLGPSCRSNNLFSYRKLKKGFESFVYVKATKEGTLMCYFGNSKGPKPNNSKNPDLYKKESDILGYFGEQISHPNEKRAIVTRIIAALGKGFDGRVINDGHFGSDGKPTNAHLFIPLKDYALHIAKYRFNMNVSGNRLSIPNRFIYSFAVGTAVLTDKLHVKWFKPFGKEVVETTEMGYLKNDEVDWDSFEQTIRNLPDVQQDEVLLEFNNKWSPEVFARYIVNECINAIETKN